jgi:hypothetical protein
MAFVPNAKNGTVHGTGVGQYFFGIEPIEFAYDLDNVHV